MTDSPVSSSNTTTDERRSSNSSILTSTTSNYTGYTNMSPPPRPQRPQSFDISALTRNVLNENLLDENMFNQSVFDQNVTNPRKHLIPSITNIDTQNQFPTIPLRLQQQPHYQALFRSHQPFHAARGPFSRPFKLQQPPVPRRASMPNRVRKYQREEDNKISQADKERLHQMAKEMASSKGHRTEEWVKNLFEAHPNV